jgi:acyl-CoA hydrolase
VSSAVAGVLEIDATSRHHTVSVGGSKPKARSAGFTMNHYKLVLPEYMNDQGILFGGYLLKWIDEFAYITANLDHPGHRFVTVAMDHVVFKHPIENGQILRFTVLETRRGRTSVQYRVEVYGEKFHEKSEKLREELLFETGITFVNISEKGEAQPMGGGHG